MSFVQTLCLELLIPFRVLSLFVPWVLMCQIFFCLSFFNSSRDIHLFASPVNEFSFNSCVSLSWASCFVSVHCILQSVSNSVCELQCCHFALEKTLKKGQSTWLGDHKTEIMSVKANHKHFRKVCLVVVLWAAPVSSWGIEVLIYYPVNWKGWDHQWLCWAFFPSDSCLVWEVVSMIWQFDAGQHKGASQPLLNGWAQNSL